MLNFAKPKTMVLGSFLFFIIIICAVIFIVPETMIDLGVNKTVGEAYGFNINAYAVFSVFTAFIVFIAGYTILWIAKKEVNKYQSGSNFLFLVSSVLIFISGLHTASIILAFLSIQLLLVNMFFGFTAKTKSKNKKLQ